MNDDAFARRFYADRSELEALGIVLAVEKPRRRARRAGELLAAAGELPPAARSSSPTRSWRRSRTALQLLDGEFAYAEPLRLALQQISWGRPSPLNAPEQRTVALGITGSAGGHDVSQRLAKIETAIFRRKTIVFDYYTMERDEIGARTRRSLPAAVPGRPVLRRRPLARARRDPGLPPLPDPRQGRLRHQGRARLPAARRLRPARLRQPDRLAVRRAGRQRRDLVVDRIAWQIERHFGRYGEIRAAKTTTGDRIVLRPDYANERQLIAWVLGSARTPGCSARRSCASEVRDRRRAAARAPHRRARDRRRPPATARRTARRRRRGPRPTATTANGSARGGDPPRALRRGWSRSPAS